MTTAQLNDRLRKAIFTRPQLNGKLVLTQGIANLHPEQLKAVAVAIINYKDFEAENDPYGEHDFGAVELPGVEKCFWKIDYYDSEACEYGTENPADPQTYRVLTVMLAEEY